MIIFRVVAALAGLFFVVAVVLMASAPWVLLQPDQVRTELNRWFLTVAGSVDAITAGVLLAIAQQPRRTLLIVELVGAVIVAGAIILPLPALLRRHPCDRRGAADRLPVLAGRPSVSIVVGGHPPVHCSSCAALAGAALLVTAAIAFPPADEQETDPAARGGW